MSTVNQMKAEMDRLKSAISTETNEGGRTMLRGELARVARQFVSKQSTSWRGNHRCRANTGVDRPTMAGKEAGQ